MRAAKEKTRLEVICTFAFEKTKQDEFRTMMGVGPADIVEPLVDAGADIIGANCGNGMERMIEIVRELRAVNKNIPILINANAGLPVVKDTTFVYPETPEQMASFLPGIIAAGVNIIGGCCGTALEHIAAMVRKVKGSGSPVLAPQT